MALEGISFTLTGTPADRVTAATVTCAASLAPGASGSNCVITVPFVKDEDVEAGDVTITDVTVAATAPAAAGGGSATRTLTGEPKTITVTKTPVLTIEVVEASVSMCIPPENPGEWLLVANKHSAP